ncbi:MAG TPA: ribosome recycling factor [Candidatus Eisenbacteria bacterium]|nr:ribosome recycling factor [Candidatus Eisenbacteria bacterium]
MEKRLAECEDRMTKGLESFRRELASIRAGKATPALLDNIRVDYYGTPTPLKQVASVSAPEARLLVVQPWDKTLLTPIARAIQTSDLGLNPQDDGQLIKIPIPPLNEERRKDLVKMAHKLAEEGRVAVRNARRDMNEQIKKAQKDGQLPEDDAHRQTEAVQKLHDKYIAQIEEILKKKEAEVMEV